MIRENQRLVVEFDATELIGFEAFHEAFAQKLGFPAFYGRNMDAWIDCMSYIDSPAAGMSKLHVGSGEVLTMHIRNASLLKQEAPEVFEALNECAAFVNWRCVEEKSPPLLALSYYS